jgi:hypothetical protein
MAESDNGVRHFAVAALHVLHVVGIRSLLQLRRHRKRVVLASRIRCLHAGHSISLYLKARPEKAKDAAA